MECLLLLGLGTKQQVTGEKLEELGATESCQGCSAVQVGMAMGDGNWGSKDRRGVQQAFLIF